MSSVEGWGVRSQNQREALAEQVAINWNKKVIIIATLIMLCVLAFGAGLMMTCMSMVSRGAFPLAAGITTTVGGAMSMIIITVVSCHFQGKAIEKRERIRNNSQESVA